MSESLAFILAEMEFQIDACEKERLVLKRSLLGLDRVMVRDEVRES